MTQKKDLKQGAERQGSVAALRNTMNLNSWWRPLQKPLIPDRPFYVTNEIFHLDKHNLFSMNIFSETKFCHHFFLLFNMHQKDKVPTEMYVQRKEFQLKGNTAWKGLNEPTFLRCQQHSG